VIDRCERRSASRPWSKRRLIAEKPRCPGLAYPGRMPDISQLVAAIDGRLADIAGEISALDAAKAELSAPHTGDQAPAATVDAAATHSRRQAARRRSTPPRPQSQPAAVRSAASASGKVARDLDGAVTVSPSTRKRRPTVTRPRPGGGTVGAERLERVLAETSAGLSANAIAKQAGGGYSRTLKLLHEMEAAGQVRRSGARRSSVWQLITDEERIAQRAAELERPKTAPSRRRGRARAS
jgi:hypothetical protein